MSKVFYLTFLFAITISCQEPERPEEPVNVIFDTDMGPDYDDVGAIAILHALADSGKANILATIASTKYEGVGPVLEILNTYFNKPQVPVAVPKGKALELRDWQHWSDTLRANYPHTRKTNNEFPDAVELYRKTLAAQPDNSVTIITVGFLTNIAALLQSAPDNYSTLNGNELVKKKVNKLVSMAGRFPSGKEFNIEEDAASAKYAIENFPSPIIFSGFEIGEKIKSGLPLINNSLIQNSPVKDVFRISIPKAKEDSSGRMSWDQTAVVTGILGHEPYYTLQEGTMEVEAEGDNKWQDKKHSHYYLIEKEPHAKMQDIINTLMQHQPTGN